MSVKLKPHSTQIYQQSYHVWIYIMLLVCTNYILNMDHVALGTEHDLKHYSAL